ncbi:hypothetical protein A20C1_00480 [marine actinobacterium PHSC20C1]|nr:hypothetical protein A20C1_00480 [marine actinobacterium PHSC20C1]
MAEFTLRGGAGTAIDAELEVKRSRFFCTLLRVDSEARARDAIEAARKQHWEARHHCSAFVIGSSTLPDQVRRAHDDGEPSGTAGRPMLDVLTGNNLVDCVAVVSRHFGGTLLGTGGLFRAYSDAVAAAIAAATLANQLVARERRELYTLSLAHSDAGRVESELRQYADVAVLGTVYGASAVVSLATALGQEQSLHERVAGITSGAGMLVHAGSQWADVELG